MHFVRAIPAEFVAVYVNTHHHLKISRSFRIRKSLILKKKYLGQYYPYPGLSSPQIIPNMAFISL